jgi:CBS domain containing-hemolysin-like protein
MWLYIYIGGLLLASVISLFFSTLTYSLRDFSRTRLAEYLGTHNGDKWFEPITLHADDLIFVTAFNRLFSNIAICVLAFICFDQFHFSTLLRNTLMVLVAGFITTFCSITIPQAAAKYGGPEIIGFFAAILNFLRIVLFPFTWLTHSTDELMRRILGVKIEVPDEKVDEDILSAVEEGEIEGVVDEQERDMIESVIELRGTTTGQIMTARQDITAIDVESADLASIKKILQQCGHTRLPVYELSLDHVIGVIHVRDLIPLLGAPPEKFDIRPMLRPPFFVPESKPLRDLLTDFRLQKIQIAIVLDEYGTTSGVATVEDILEELVGDISDEHDKEEPAMLKRLDDRVVEADARIRVDEFNRLSGVTLREDGGYETLGGFLTTAMSRIPEKGAVFEQDGVKYTILDAEPQRVKRVRIEVLPPPARRESA